MPFLLLSVFLVLPQLSLAKEKERYVKPAPIHLDKEGEKWAEKTLKKMSLEQKIGQMFMIWARVSFMNVNGPEYKLLRDNMRKYHIGGFGVTIPVEGGLLVKGDPYDAAMLLNQLQRDADTPLLMAADFERGLTMRLNGPTTFPYAMAFGAAANPAFAEALGRITGEESRAIGIHWNWFPVADVNSNPLNPIINTRSFSSDPQQVSELVAAYIKGAHSSGMLVTAKHFPGHGDTATDTHLGLASVNGNLERLQTVELPPFKRAIEAGVDSVMIAHVSVPALDPDPNHVASNSSKIVTDLLKHQMGFQGIVVTDALDMNGLMRLYSNIPGVNPSGAAAVATVKAGNDMVIIPHDLDGAYQGLLNAAKSGEIPLAQINASVLKILKEKAALGLNKARLVDPEQVGQEVAKPENVAMGQQVSDAAITLVRDNGQVLPLQREIVGTDTASNPYVKVQGTTNRIVAVVFTDDVRSDLGRVFDRQLRSRIPDAHVFYVDSSIAAGIAEEVAAAVAQAEKVIIPVYLVPVPGKMVKTNAGEKNLVSLADASGSLMQRILQQAGPRAVMVAMGNPYMVIDYPQLQNYLCTFSTSTVSEISAVKALFGEIPIAGHLPVDIPGIAQRGAGMSRPQTVKGGLATHVEPGQGK